MERTNDLPCLFQVIVEFSCSGQCTINKYFRQAIDLVPQLTQSREKWSRNLAHELLCDNGPLVERGGYVNR